MKSKAYQISLQLYTKCCSNGLLRRLTLEQYSELSYEKVDTGLIQRFIPEEITILNARLFLEGNFSTRAIKMITRIIEELCINNALWYFDGTTSTADSTVLKELREKELLLKTEDPRIHYVNPDKIRRGSKPQVLACTTKELENVTRVTRDNIRNLGYREPKVLLNLLDITTLK